MIDKVGDSFAMLIKIPDNMLFLNQNDYSQSGNVMDTSPSTLM
jgi:hypothetical protein